MLWHTHYYDCFRVAHTDKTVTRIISIQPRQVRMMAPMTANF